MTDPITTVTKPSSLSSEYVANDHVSTTVVEAVAKADGISPLEVSPSLYTAIDPDALDQLFAASGSGASSEFGLRFDDEWTPTELSFTYAGYDVTVSSTRDDGISVSLLEK
ncbi:HalOD1 output domain-containing protein [Halomontanus rarus]|uniref:HalOD1 output domain-containing protein n=1 Tax=Halomontanus rarus TaxID=3034020 RepID=UPI0023E851A2|nr:HalOD1 output domain-containing protein [Halovivax sp. TS33]